VTTELVISVRLCSRREPGELVSSVPDLVAQPRSRPPCIYLAPVIGGAEHPRAIT
jgi:hypothetical protein